MVSGPKQRVRARAAALRDDLQETVRVARLRSPMLPNVARSRSDVIVSLTTFPERVEHVWITIETILRQQIAPALVVLVLADEEFPRREIPSRLRRLRSRGLEILWTKDNIRSYKKLIPTRKIFPDATIVTVDDDIAFRPWLLGALKGRLSGEPRSVVGCRGWETRSDSSGLAPYRSWVRASSASPPSCTFLTSGAGMAFAPDSAPIELIADAELALKLCPTADDVWWWGVTRASGTRSVCLGERPYWSVRRQAGGSALRTVNYFGGANDVQIERVVRYFGLDVESNGWG